MRAYARPLALAATACACTSCGHGAYEPPAARHEVVPLAPAALVVAPPPADARATARNAGTAAEFHDVDFHVASDIVLRIHYLRGTMRSRTPGAAVVFDDKRSFVIDIDAAEVGLTTSDLAHLMNEHVFAYHGAPLSHLSFATRGGELVQRGVMHKVVNIPFEITAAVSVTPAGLLRIHPTTIRIFSVNGRGLMKALGITLQKLLDLRRATGVHVEGNDLLLDPDSVLPAPAIEGRVTAVRVQGNELVQVFGDSAAWAESRAAPIAPLDSSARNDMRFRGGTLRFGKLFMVQSDMEIIDADPGDPFDFSIDDYNRQLVAGYSRSTADGGLKVYMPDLDKLKK